MNDLSPCFDISGGIKSDQNGIESALFEPTPNAVHSDKIRPKWD